jgi:hypothetical protein
LSFRNLSNYPSQQHYNYAKNNYIQSTTTTTSGLGSNYTSYTTDPLDSSSMSSLVSENKHQRTKFNQNQTLGTPSSFLESDLAPEEFLYIPDEGGNPRFISPQMIAMSELEQGKFVTFLKEKK